MAKMMMANKRSRAMLTKGPMALAMEDMTTWRPDKYQTYLHEHLMECSVRLYSFSTRYQPRIEDVSQWNFEWFKQLCLLSIIIHIKSFFLLGLIMNWYKSMLCLYVVLIKLHNSLTWNSGHQFERSQHSECSQHGKIRTCGFSIFRLGHQHRQKPANISIYRLKDQIWIQYSQH